MKRPNWQIRHDLVEHLAGDGTMNDGRTDDLYRESCDIPEGDDTDLEAVESWAVELVDEME